jgi:predicted nuclease of predicted toxin-antitoxin system
MSSVGADPTNRCEITRLDENDVGCDARRCRDASSLCELEYSLGRQFSIEKEKSMDSTRQLVCGTRLDNKFWRDSRGIADKSAGPDELTREEIWDRAELVNSGVSSVDSDGPRKSDTLGIDEEEPAVDNQRSVDCTTSEIGNLPEMSMKFLRPKSRVRAVKAETEKCIDSKSRIESPIALKPPRSSESPKLVEILKPFDGPTGEDSENSQLTYCFEIGGSREVSKPEAVGPSDFAAISDAN